MGGYEFGEGYNLKYCYWWFVFYLNGDFYFYLFDEGFLGFDCEFLNESWGKVMISGKKMILELKFWGWLKFEKVLEF